MEEMFLNPIHLVIFITYSLVPLVLVYLYLKLLYSVIINRKTIDKPGRKWMRIISQILILIPLSTILIGTYLLLAQLLFESYGQGCTSGPGMGDCFSHGILLVMSLPVSFVTLIVGLILYRFATSKSQVL